MIPNVHAFDGAEIKSLCAISKQDFSVKESRSLCFCDRENDNFTLWCCDRENDNFRSRILEYL